MQAAQPINLLVVLNQELETLFERRLPNDLGEVLSRLEPYREELEGIAIESTRNWYWLVDGLMEAGYHFAIRFEPLARRFFDRKSGKTNVGDAAEQRVLRVHVGGLEHRRGELDAGERGRLRGRRQHRRLRSVRPRRLPLHLDPQRGHGHRDLAL